MPSSNISLNEVLKDRNRCPFCGGISVTARKCKKETLGSKIAVSQVVTAEIGDQMEFDVQDYAYSCTCDSCGMKYYNHGFNKKNLEFFNDCLGSFDPDSLDYGSRLRTDYANQTIQDIFNDIHWDNGSLVCEIHKKSWFLSRRHSSAYIFFLTHGNGNILKMFTDFVQSQDDEWRELKLVKVGYARRRGD